MSFAFLDESDDDDDLFTVSDSYDYLRRFMAASAIDRDLDFAFNLQLEEAINASLSVPEPASSTSSSSPSPLTSEAGPSYTVGETSGSSSVSHPQGQFRLERLNHSSAVPMIIDDVEPGFGFRMRYDDEKLSHSLGQLRLEPVNYGSMVVPIKFGDQKPTMMFDDEKPTLEVFKDLTEEDDDDHGGEFGQGFFANVRSDIFRVCCKGLIEKSSAPNGKPVLCGIGVSICDSKGNSVFDISKPLHDDSMCRQGIEVKALIEGLNIASAFGIQKVVFPCDRNPIVQYAIGNWKPKQKKVEALVSELFQQRKRFTYCIPELVSTNDILLACSLAREAIELQKPESSGVERNYETCVICLGDIDISQIFSVDVCKHRYCFTCMKRHVEAKLRGGMLPECPHEGCKSELKTETCSKFLTPALVELMTQRLKEASILVTDRLYCPHPKCSALMSKKEILLRKATSTLQNCVKCNGQFCIACNVPWHTQMTCWEYKTRYPYPSPSEGLLKCLAQTQSWRQCVKCQHMIELTEGCYHMTCRCGYEFCYTCGAEYKDKKATCKCPSWDEGYIFASDDDSDDEDDWLI